jgi:hypothetical protein
MFTRGSFVEENPIKEKEMNKIYNSRAHNVLQVHRGRGNSMKVKISKAH